MKEIEKKIELAELLEMYDHDYVQINNEDQVIFKGYVKDMKKWLIQFFIPKMEWELKKVPAPRREGLEYLWYEVSRGKVYPNSAAFALWMIDNDLYKILSQEAQDRMNEFVGESEHNGEIIPEDLWMHLFHIEKGLQENCLTCLVGRQALDDYKEWIAFDKELA